MKIAVIGAGIAGLSAAWLLEKNGHAVTLYEKQDRFGGHANTVDATFPDGQRLAVDTGFIVYNERNYPHLTALFRHFDVATIASDMSFAASLEDGRFEYGTQTLGQIFAQRRHLASPRFYRLLLEIKRFFRHSLSVIAQPEHYTLKNYMNDGKYSDDFVERFLIPMGAAIWSTPAGKILDFPAASFITFFRNHGLLSTSGQPQWRTVQGGSRRYVEKIIAALQRPLVSRPAQAVIPSDDYVTVQDSSGTTETFEAVVLACHADETLQLLHDKTDTECNILGCFAYQANEAVLHSDSALMPRRQRAWSSWNYLGSPEAGVAVTYWMNRLQSLPAEYPLFVTLNCTRQIDAAKIHARIAYTHPLFDAAARRAQLALPSLQGQRRLWYCGSYHGYGFHEDALRSSVEMVQRLGGSIPWL